MRFLANVTSLALLATLLTTGCAAPVAPKEPGPLGLPALTLETELVPGSTLSGPGRGLSGGAERGPSVFRVRFLYLEHMAGDELRPIESASALVADLKGSNPLLFGATLAAGAALAEGEDALGWIAALEEGGSGRFTELLTEELILPAGATVHVIASAPETVEDPLDWMDEYRDRGPIERRVAVAVSDDEGGIEVALSIDDLDPVAEQERLALAREATIVMASPPGPAEEENVRRETLLLSVAPSEGKPLLLVWPSPFDGGDGRAFAALLELSNERPESEAVERARTLLGEVAERHARQIAPLEQGGFAALRLEQALRAFRDRGGRSALLLLSNEAGAPLTDDLALFAEEELLAQLSALAFPDVPAADVSVGTREPLPADLGWRLERSAWNVLCSRAVEETLSPEGSAALLRHAGALGRFPDVLLDVVAASVDADDFAARVLIEQRYFLDDPDPSARLRAHEWMAARGAAVPDYDPLAERDARRAALKAQQAAAEAASAQAPEVDP